MSACMSFIYNFYFAFYRSNSPLKKAADDWNPCSRVTVLSALKESRKRSFIVEDNEEEFMRPTKRCYYPDCIHVHCQGTKKYNFLACPSGKL